jgi:hypothetical protein
VTAGQDDKVRLWDFEELLKQAPDGDNRTVPESESVPAVKP